MGELELAIKDYSVALQKWFVIYTILCINNIWKITSREKIQIKIISGTLSANLDDCTFLMINPERIRSLLPMEYPLMCCSGSGSLFLACIRYGLLNGWALNLALSPSSLTPVPTPAHSATLSCHPTSHRPNYFSPHHHRHNKQTILKTSFPPHSYSSI